MRGNRKPQPAEEVLVVKGLSTRLALTDGKVGIPLVEGVDLTVKAGERWAIVGESGSGKSVTARAIMGLLDPPLDWKAERIEIGGQDMTTASRADWRGIRGTRVALVQQDPLNALSPVYTVGNQLAETLRRKGLAASQARLQVLSLLRQVGIPDPELRQHTFPHEMSGGMRQRVAIALALACTPQLLLADEPTTALDVTVQAQILNLLVSLSNELGMAIVMITHDIGILLGFAHQVAVMYGGRLMEVGPVSEVLAKPAHPYTRALLRAQPGRAPDAERRRLPMIAGTPPSLSGQQRGCPFAARCDVALPHCASLRPEMRVSGPRRVACHLAFDREVGAR
jgi:oligopeptide/dipeptide ABC transporter ATP-binding protein